MLIVPTVVLILTTVVLLTSTLLRLRRPLDSALLVPGAWLATIPIQSLVLSSTLQFETSARNNMYYAIATANLLLAVYQWLLDAAWFASLKDRLRKATSTNNGASGTDTVRYWFWGLLVVACALAVLHWAMMPRIPLLQLIQGSNDHQLTLARENSAKLLAAPTMLKYVFNWNSRILLPLLFTTAILHRWRLAAIFVGVFGMLYAVSPLEKFPSALLVLGPVIAVAIRDGKRMWSPLVIAGFAAAFLPPFAISQAISINDRLHPAPATTPAAARSPISPGTALERIPGPVGGALDLALRRIGEGPADVTYAWFAYFPEHHAFLNGSGWEPWRVLSPAYQTPANLVGRWAYYGKQGYDVPSISAYGSFVADGWAEFGMTGVVIAGLWLLAFLALLELVRAISARLLCLACYATAVVLIAATAPQAGLPAMMFSQGLWLVPVICIAFLVTEGRFRGIGRSHLAHQPSAP